MNLRKNHGFGLIEVLVALAIMAVGLLAVASFQSGLIGESAESKARAEAVAIAQDRIEQIRNYTDVAYDSAAFDTLFADISEGNATTFTGSNTVFTRTETIVEPNDTKEIDVIVSWVDVSGANQQVVLSTEISWESPSLEGELDNESSAPLVRSATGRAELGAGDVLDSDNVVKELGELLGLIDRGDGDLRLSSGEDVVLTLKDACLLDDEGARTEVPCTDFVKISGRVFIDQTTQATNPTDVFVIASDAAFCQRYYLTNKYDALGNLIAVDVPTDIKDADISNFATKPNGDYLYYYYTCYLGGGWHGNIGLLVTAKNNSQDTVKACVGDPTSLDAYADPEVAIRRVYRGMAFKYIDDAHTQKEMNGDEIVYYTVGVADALQLPDPDDETQVPHDFVISSISGSDGSECISEGIMVRGDSNDGSEFAGNPTSFYCLNQNVNFVDQIKLDALDYGVDEACPFDPSDPPNQKHTISGVVNISAPLNDVNTVFVRTTNVNTSDGPLNCVVDTDSMTHDGSNYVLPYSCDVYQWTNPWSGYLQVTPNLNQFTCTRYRKRFTSIGDDTFNIDFQCENKIDNGIYGNIVISGNNSSLATAINISGDVNEFGDNTCSTDIKPDYSCATVNFLNSDTWSGTVTLSGTKLCTKVVSDPDGVVTINEDASSKATIITITNASSGNISIDISDEQAGNPKCP
ncbi:prepilin-type N-terminal cleavage/methylation domain-containing protein [Thalassomonas sp. M1454]|uniref:prepilin-type N-terminal cleavage/methylation domain-containing protein n=1 Tax=Thalassomonas sp. M1454 TaxID=2594477 RepID=UPI00163D715D|nr:prepilin-type N-terminal cleavage/methylation domain-containing protein [Thalassomonas sp. M1454]